VLAFFIAISSLFEVNHWATQRQGPFHPGARHKSSIQR
jgi:hypothetical protein